MSLAPGTRLGPYEILGALGAGGMGEVYRARDTRLARDVAIKALPDEFARDPERLARFEREARLLASLSHANVGTIYGLEESGGHRYLVLELVEGETLSQRLARGPLPLDEALQVGRQIAAALEAAHESGIIHRDLKPGNVMLTPAGGIKVLDFGLAKGGATADATSDPGLSASPTMTYAATGAGVILGTAASMSPEQARGKAVDKRTDIWSFACVLYECLTGHAAFEGETVSDLIARILEREPDLGRLPARTPGRLRQLLRRCLEKDPRRRMRDIGDARIEIEDLIAARSSASARVAPAGRRASLRSYAGVAAAAALVTAAALLLPRALHRAPLAHAVRFAVSAPEGVNLNGDGSQCGISPDGRTLAFTAVDSTGTVLVWVRPLESLTARALAGTDNADQPFWSPDSRTIGFFADGKLKKVAIQGGTPEVLCDAQNGRGGSWNRDGDIVFAPAGQGPIFRVSENGGEPRPVTTLDTTRHETAHRYPWFLPDGKHFLFSALPGRQGLIDVEVGSLEAPKRVHVLAAGSGATYGPPGCLIYARNRTLAAQRFDASRLRLIGEPVPLGDVPAGSNYAGARIATVSNTGALAFVSGHVANTSLVLYDRAGRRERTVPVPPGRYLAGAISPDGRRAAMERETSPTESDVWIVDLERGAATRFTFGPARNGNAVWSPDGARIVFESNREGPWDLYIKPASGATPEEPFYRSTALLKHPDCWSRDGRLVMMQQLDNKTGWDLWIVPVDGDRTPRPYLRTPFNERFSSLSPDGKWIAYTSDESGRNEVYVQSFPNPVERHQVSTGGGFGPVWRNDGKEIGFGNPNGLSGFVADVRTEPRLEIGVPRAFAPLPSNVVSIAASPDLSRFLLTMPTGETTPLSMTVVLDWAAALQKP